MKSWKVCLSLIIFLSGVLPSFAIMDVRISKDYYYDTHTTIMKDIEPQTLPLQNEFWSKNIFHLGKYRPFFMLSNKELGNFMPKSIVASPRIYTPSVYNISLKNSSITNVSLKPEPVKKQEPAKTLTNLVTVVSNQNDLLLKKYEAAKIQKTDIDQKIDVAILLKESKIKSNYQLAFNLLNDVIAVDAYNAYAYCVKAEIYAEKNDPEHAIKNYAEALRINPLSKQSCLGLAKVLEPRNKELAKKYYNLAKND